MKNRIKFEKVSRFAGIAFFIALCPSAFAQVVFQENFETPQGVGYLGPDLSGGKRAPAVPGWIGSNGGYGSSAHGVYNEFVHEPEIAPFSTPYGDQAFWLLGPNTGLTTAQGATGIVFEAGKTYRVKVNAAALRPGVTAGFNVQLVAMEPGEDDAARLDHRSPVGTVVADAPSSTSLGDMSAVTEAIHTVLPEGSEIGKEVAIRFFRSHGVVYDNLQLIVGHDFKAFPAFLQSVVGTTGASQPLTWTNPAPVNEASGVLVDLYFGKDPENLTKVVDAAANLTSFDVAITDSDDRFWQVVVYTEGVKTGLSVTSSVLHFVVDDFDDDGLPDAYELANTNPPSTTAMQPNEDPDNDTLSNLDEYRWNTDPLVADTDGDTLLDGVELSNSPATNPLEQDTDADGWRDDHETNTGVFISLLDTGTNPVMRDTDGDGLRDGVETNNPSAFPTELADRYEAWRIDVGTDPHDPDTDGDGSNDWYEVCATFTNPHVNSAEEKPAHGVTYPISDPDPADVGLATGPIKVYIMAGQSNMVGVGYLNKNKERPGSMPYATQVDGLFTHTVDENGDWLPRHDVRYREVLTEPMNIPLTVGGPNGTTRLGPEIGFGHQMGEFHDEPVLLIKASWGNRGLGWDFLPPGSPRLEVNGVSHAGHHESPQRWPTGTTPEEKKFYGGWQYDVCFRDESLWTEKAGLPFAPVTNVYDVLTNFDSEFPQWAGRGFEIAGIVWWQGHWDKSDNTGVYSGNYETNLVRLIDSLRADFNAPDAPFVVGSVGFKYDQGRRGFDQVFAGQMAVSDPDKYPRFDGNVTTVNTIPYWRELSESPGNQDFHYNNNCVTYTLVGDALARAMIALKIDGSPALPDLLVTQLSPPNGTTDFDARGSLVVDFNDTVGFGSGEITIRNLTDSTQQIIPVTDGSQVMIQGSVLTIQPSQGLERGKQYAVSLSAGLVENSDFSVFRGILDDTTWSFMTSESPPITRLLFEDFETPDVSTEDSVGSTNNTAPSNNWVMTSDGYRHEWQGVIDKGAGDFIAPDPNQQAYAMRYTNTGLWTAPNVLGVVTAGATYTVSFSVGQDLESAPRREALSYNAKLVGINKNSASTIRRRTDVNPADVLAQQGGRAQLGGAFETVTFSVTVDPSNPMMMRLIGRELALVFTGFSTAANIDNVTVTMSSGGEVVQGTFQQWKSQNGLPVEASITADSDGDGIADGIEYFFGTDPTQVSSGLQVGGASQVSQTEASTQFSFMHPENEVAALDLVASYRWSTDLSSFHESGETFNGSTVTFTKQKDTPVPGTSTVVANVVGAKIDQIYVRVVVGE